MAKNQHVAKRQDERDQAPQNLTIDEAIAVFDKSAKHTRPNVQTAAWGVLRAEILRLREYEVAAGMLSIEKAEWRRRADAAERDAARYRWLRQFDVDSYVANGSRERLDAAIDAAMRQEGGNAD